MGDIVIKKRHTIRKDEAHSVMAALEHQIRSSVVLFRAERVERVETDSPFTLYLINRQPVIMKYEDWVFPTLKGALLHPFPERRITVDQGAIPFVINGADVMRPGITGVTQDVTAQEPVLVVDEIHNKPIAVGVALLGGSEILQATKGKMVKTIHYVGDQLWRLEV